MDKEIALKAVELLDKYKTLKEVSVVLGVNYQQLSYTLCKYGLNQGLKTKQLTQEELKSIALEHNSGKSLTSLAKEYGIPRKRISKELKAANFSVRSNHEIPICKIEKAINILQEQEITLEELSTLVDICPENLSKELKKRKITNKGMHNLPTDSDIEECIQEYLQGKSIAFISKQKNFFYKTLTEKMREKGIKIERGMGSSDIEISDQELEQELLNYSFPSTERNYKLKCLINFNPFLDLTREATQYWLGILASDGNVNSVRGLVRLGMTDEELIKDYIKFIGKPLKIYTVIPKKVTYKTQYYVEFINKEVVNFLVELGITPRKSKTLKMNIPLTFPFIRGVIDGDGCIKQPSAGSVEVQISSASLSFLEQIHIYLLNKGIYSKTTTQPSIHTLHICNKDNVKKFYHYLYYNAEYFLERKKSRYSILEL